MSVTAESSVENSAYASSTISRPLTFAIESASNLICEIETDPPVGLLGVVIKVNAGLTCAICSTASSTLSEKSEFRFPSTQFVPHTLAMSGCIE